jgi:Flp pilus assembly protein TadG
MTFIYKARYRRPIHPKASGGFWIKEQAQSLLEVAVFITFFIPLVCYAIDLGYFYIVAAALSSSARNAAEYSIQGNAATASSKLPDGASVAALATGDLSSFPSVSTSIYVCSNSLVTSSHPSNCQSYGTNAVSYTPDIDPENTMKLNLVHVVYTISPPIPLGFAGTSLSMIPTSFRRTVEMRAIN